ncbi:hypothetical protein PGT21_022293 [Puccinia graminis f. sp. tritici]|uniref:DUF6589 domain-containing protein n=1 Tax=Puccinia graminis f. sp. tritici TaxID=56615 RepID=A0A5B0QWQ6_PUCGR|nr:hypothetical protein PGT21_022293 [Puccinia graminis f. sp. tritici]
MPRHTSTQRKNQTRSEHSKLTAICQLISQMGYTPKSFLAAFLTTDNLPIAVQRRYWSTPTGWPSTLRLLGTIRNFSCQKRTGKARWENFILEEASKVVNSQKPPRGAYPQGAYHNSKKISASLFTNESKQARDQALATEHMPFLFDLIFSKLKRPTIDTVSPINGEQEDSDKGSDHVPEIDLQGDEMDPNNDFNINTPVDHNERAYTVAKTICSMVAFVTNRRNNGDQLANSLTFLSSGVTDRVNIFLNYIGLTSSRKTAHHALNHLSRQAENRISSKLAKSPAKNLAPFLCVDNLDFKQRIHTKSMGHASQMFHGTWGYIHHPSPELIASVPVSDLTIESYYHAMSKASTFDVHSKMLLPTPKEEVHWEMVLKSQITEALLGHLASPTESFVSIPTKPPIIDQLSNERPDITMLKLMIASDNSAQGAGEVFESISHQSTLPMTKFSSRLQIVDGDLGTCTNVTSLRTQRVPSDHKEDSLSNIATLLGGAHTMWNVAQAIYSKHFGDSSDSRDSGAWRFLDSLGIPSHKMLEKKDFTLMIKNIKKIHKATLVYCLIASLTEELTPMSSSRIQDVVEETYSRFFSAQAKLDATLQPSPKLSNLILRLADFATVVEGDAAMKAGDIGRVMNVWKRWAVLAQGIKKLTQYSIQLPRMILLLNEVLPPGLRHILKHSLFVAPSGRQKHFVAKDQFLESQNYWLKHFFNNTGRGTNINRLKNTYSLNVPLLDEHVPKKVEDFYDVGIQKMKKLFVTKGKPLNKLRPPPMKIWSTTIDEELEKENDDSDVSVDGDVEPDVTDDELQSNQEDENEDDDDEVQSHQESKNDDDTDHENESSD